VFKAVMQSMRFWFDAGVDGMRLDAVPFHGTDANSASSSEILCSSPSAPTGAQPVSICRHI